MSEIVQVTFKNKQCNIVYVGHIKLYFSYKTLVAYENVYTGEKYQSDVRYSVTTSKHKSLMGCGNFPQVSEENLQQFVIKNLKGI